MEQQVKTVFYQGMQCSQTQAAKYLDPREGFVSPLTGERVRCTRGLPLLINYFAEAPEIAEVFPEPTSWGPREALWAAPAYALCRLKHWWLSTEVLPPAEPHPSGKSLKGHTLDLTRISVGQEPDMECHRRKVEALPPGAEVVLWGVSRGAATTLNAVAAHAYHESRRVRLVVLEGCLDTVCETVRASYVRPLAWVVRGLLRSVSSYREDGPQPIRSAANVPHDVPVLFVTSRVDRVVPMRATLAVARRVAATGHPNVHLLVLERASHSSYMMHNDADSRRYREAVHALYEHYGLPHSAEYAAGGREWVASSRVGGAGGAGVEEEGAE